MNIQSVWKQWRHSSMMYSYVWVHPHTDRGAYWWLALPLVIDNMPLSHHAAWYRTSYARHYDPSTLSKWHGGNTSDGNATGQCGRHVTEPNASLYDPSTMSKWHGGGTSDGNANGQCGRHATEVPMPRDKLRATPAIPEYCRETSKKLQWLYATLCLQPCFYLSWKGSRDVPFITVSN
jgi:hypothetical protein